ncbi:phage holin [Liquorilactobacillus vini]|uniref:phage holin n=1 Tax=Liquorilactobacillus vini TaxID=238015 RepID=UPI0003033045|nr:phage holin [Liquorilactobacillus vini]
MNVQNISDLIIAIAAAAVPVVFAYITKFLKDNKQAMSILDAVAPLAKDAVVAAEKLGVDKYLEGAVKKSKAVEYVENALNDLGFDKADLTTIENAVEKAYAELKDTLEAVYPQKTEAQEESETLDEQIAAAQKAADEAAAKVKELQAKKTTATVAK